jgi:predicted NAD/FAD-binding protein
MTVVDQPVARSVAVIGSGVAGLTAAYVLSGRDRVTLGADGATIGVDSAFLVRADDIGLEYAGALGMSRDWIDPGSVIAEMTYRHPLYTRNRLPPKSICRPATTTGWFGRMWELYLAYSEAGFRSGYLDVYRWTLARGGGG